MKIQLINPPVPQSYSRCTRSGCFPPLDLLSLATYVQARRPKVSLEILDGDLLSFEEIMERLDADIVGISPKVLSYETAMAIAQVAYASGCRVIVGGSWVSAMPRAILRNRPYIEAVCLGDGEEALLAFADGIPLAKVSNVAYRNGKSIVIGKRHTMNLDEQPVVNYRLVDIDAYMANYCTRFPDHPFSRPLSYYSHKGCFWHDASGGCIFCRHQHSKNIRRSPKRFWSDVKEMVDSHRCDLIWDVSDTFTSPRHWVYDIVKAKPQDVNCRFYVYGRASDLDEKMVGVLRHLGCFEILIGVESGNDALLKRVNKGITRASILKAVRLCAQYGIQVFPTFLLGLPGESQTSINDTLCLAREIVACGNVREISSAILLPLQGSPIFSSLCEYLDSPSWILDSDILDLASLQLSYIENFTHVSLVELQSANREIQSLVAPEYRSTFGGVIDTQALAATGVNECN